MRYWLFYGISILGILFIWTLHLTWGSVQVPMSEVFNALVGKPLSDTTFYDIVWKVRMPRALADIFVGAALAVAGLLMQTFFQNPLAEPSVLGLSSGASLGIALLRLGGVGIVGFSFQNAWLSVIFAMLGTSLVLTMMLSIATKVKSPFSLLLLGMMVGNFAYAFVSLMQHFSSPEAVMDFWRWSMGSTAGVVWEQLYTLVSVIVLGLAMSWLLSYNLNGWLLGEHYAQSMGISVGKMRLQLIALVSILSGVTTAFCGAISFIGLAVPMPIRAILRTSRHELLIPAVALAGAFVLLLCDLFARNLPLNVMTALLGSPVIVWIILKTRNQA